MPLTEDQETRLGAIVDKAENFLHGTKIPLPAETHIEMMKGALREIRDHARQIYVELQGDDPWETNEPNG